MRLNALVGGLAAATALVFSLFGFSAANPGYFTPPSPCDGHTACSASSSFPWTGLFFFLGVAFAAVTAATSLLQWKRDRSPRLGSPVSLIAKP